MIFRLPKPKVTEEKANDHHFAYNSAVKILKYKGVTIFATIIIIVVSIIGIGKVWINSSFLDKFEKDSEIVLTDAFINEHFGGTSTVNLILDSEEKDAFKNPEILKLVDKMQKDVVDSLHLVGNSFSLTDYINRMNKVMHADNEQFNNIPNDQNLIAQYLLLYEMSGDPENLWKVVDYSYNKLNVNFQLKSDNSKAINAAIAEIETFKDDFEKARR